MKIGIIGGGMIAQFHAMAIQAMANGTLHSAYIRNEEKAAEFKANYPCTVYHDLDEFLADSELEVVTIATPSGAHLQPALAAAKADKHIIVEKPLEVTTEKIDQLIDACDQAGVTLAGIFNRRFHPAMDVAKLAIEQGRLGQLTLAEASIRWFRDQAYYDSGAWRGTWKLDGGGALMNQSIHAIDQLLYLAGPVKRLSASMACLTHDNIEVEDTAVAILEFTNGGRGIIQGSTSCYSSDGNPAEIHLSGSTGHIVLSDESFSHWDFKEEAPEDAEIREKYMVGAAAGMGANDPTAINFTGHQKNFEAVIEAIQAGKNPPIDGHEARKAVELIRAIYQSAQNNGEWVELAHD